MHCQESNLALLVRDIVALASHLHQEPRPPSKDLPKKSASVTVYFLKMFPHKRGALVKFISVILMDCTAKVGKNHSSDFHKFRGLSHPRGVTS